ncbi:MAG TPA: hypothetical protein DCM05_08510 [Elusimicrobia bacterium]|nr:hypothetical protein [Elusimicrobiota bacterium]
MHQDIKSFVQGLQDLFAEDLVSVILYGSAARGGHVAGASDVNVLVILRTVELGELSAAAEVLLKARGARIAPTFWAEGELRSSADVFPVEYRDILSSYQVVHGADLLAGVQVSERNLRHQLEYELRSKLLRLRSDWLVLKGEPKALEAALAAAGGAFSKLLEEAKKLAGLRLPEGTGGSFERCRKLKRRELRLGTAELEELFGQVHDEVAALAAAVDELGR